MLIYRTSLKQPSESNSAVSTYFAQMNLTFSDEKLCLIVIIL